MKTIEIDFGTTFLKAAKQAVEHCNNIQEDCQFFFNNIQIIVCPGYNPAQLNTEYDLRSYIRRLEMQKD